MRKKVLSDCSECRNETNHAVLHSFINNVDIIDEEGKIEITEFGEYCTIQCMGCENVSFLLITKIDGKKGKEEIHREVYPSPYDYMLDECDYGEDSMLSESAIATLPPLVRNIYLEVEEAFTIDLPILSGIGLRTLLEAICIEQNISGRNLKDKIDNLHKAGFIAAKDLPVLHDLREIGNITVHQIKRPTQKTLDYSLEILLHTLKSVYTIPRLHAKLMK